MRPLPLASMVVLRLPRQLSQITRAAVVARENDLGAPGGLHNTLQRLVLAAGSGTLDAMFRCIRRLTRLSAHQRSSLPGAVGGGCGRHRGGRGACRRRVASLKRAAAMLAIHAIATWRARLADVGQLLVRSRCLHRVAVSCCVTCHAVEVTPGLGQSRQSQFGGARFTAGTLSRCRQIRYQISCSMIRIVVGLSVDARSHIYTEFA